MTESWVPAACTLPTAAQPLRLAEFDALFTGSALAVDRPELGRLRVRLRPAAAGAAADLMTRETACCGFFTFTLGATAGAVWLDVAVTGDHMDVLDALAGRIRP